jgi:hypothetical protein
MSAPRSDFLKILTERGFIHQVSDLTGLDAALSEGRISAYIGFDCTAPSLHVGSLVQIMMLHWLQQTGHRPIVLMGGGTTRVGDPSGRDEGRKLLTLENIESNKAGIAEVFAKFLTFGGGPTDAVMVDNAEWLTKLNYIDFLRDVGRHFSVNHMLSFDSVRLRLDREQPLSFIEFNYMILQGYDFVELANRYGCRLQMGGSDQWGNHRQRHRSRAPHGHAPALRADDAADHARVRRQDGQDRLGRDLAQSCDAEPLRLLAVLAQHRGRRCGALPAPVHDLADGRDREARGAARGRDQRGQEGARHPGHEPPARARRG